MCFVAALAIAGVGLVACDDDDAPKTVTHTVTFEGQDFACLVDSPQYNGPLIYSAAPYVWTDPTTGLRGEVEKDDWTAFGSGYGWRRGFALSTYVKDAPDLIYDSQLTVPTSNGSQTFAVCYGDSSRMTFTDGLPHRIVSMDVSPTTYLLNDLRTHRGQADYRFEVRLNGRVIYTGAEGWQRVDLNMDATELVFTFDGTDRTQWGLVTPMYLAVDNIVIATDATD